MHTKKFKDYSFKKIFNLINNKKPLVLIGSSYVDFNLKLKLILDEFIQENRLDLFKLSLSDVNFFESYFKNNIFNQPTLIILNYDELFNHPAYNEYLMLSKNNLLPDNIHIITIKKYKKEEPEDFFYNPDFKTFLIKNKH